MTLTATGKGVTVEKKITVKVVDVTNTPIPNFFGAMQAPRLGELPVLVEPAPT